MRFSDVEHQERAVSILRRALASGRTHHAYLFEGPDGVGKERTGIALATRLLCEDETIAPEADACGACRACRLIEAGNHPDFHLIHRGLHKDHPDRAVRAGKGLFIAVNVIRHFLIEHAVSSPSLGRRRVFLIRDAERMNEGAQNALLKTLEEPPGGACLILVTSSAQRLLPTIRSRCQGVAFGWLPAGFVEQQLLSARNVDADAARTLAGLAQGRLGAAFEWARIDLLATLEQIADALRNAAFNNPEAFGKTMIEHATQLATRSAQQRPDADRDDSDLEVRAKGKSPAKSVETDQLRDALKLVALLIAALQRDALVLQSGGAQRPLLPTVVGCTQQVANSRSAEQLADAIEAVATAEHMLDRNVAPQLVCERLAVALEGQLAPS